MSTKCLSWAVDLTTGSSTRKIVLLLLADLADEQFTCYPGRDYLAERAELSHSAVSRAVSGLCADGFLRVLRRAKRSGGRTSNRYLLLVKGDATPLPDVDDWVGEYTPTADEPAGEGNSGAQPPLPDDPDETAGESNRGAQPPLPEPGNGAPAPHSNEAHSHVSSKEDVYPLGTTQTPVPPPPSDPHPRRGTSSAAADDADVPDHTDDARNVLRRATADVDPHRLPTDTERARLVKRVVALLYVGWQPDQLVQRLDGMGPLTTVASVYAVLTSRLDNVGAPPPPPATPAEAASTAPQAWCGAKTCDRTTRRVVDAAERPQFRIVEGHRVALWCPDCSGR